MFDIFAKSAKCEITFKTIVINESNKDFNIIKCREVLNGNQKKEVNVNQLNALLHNKFLAQNNSNPIKNERQNNENDIKCEEPKSQIKNEERSDENNNPLNVKQNKTSIVSQNESNNEVCNENKNEVLNNNNRNETENETSRDCKIEIQDKDENKNQNRTESEISLIQSENRSDFENGNDTQIQNEVQSNSESEACNQTQSDCKTEIEDKDKNTVVNKSERHFLNASPSDFHNEIHEQNENDIQINIESETQIETKTESLTQTDFDEMADIETNSLLTVYSDDYNSCNSYVTRGAAGLKFQTFLSNSFNKQNFSDLKIVFTDKNSIYCHKTILMLRNKKFWEKCSQNIVIDSGIETVFIFSHSYHSFYPFVQYLYGFEPQLENHMIERILKLSYIYEEPEMVDLCARHIEKNMDFFNGINVCKLYRRTVECPLPQIKVLCIEFVAKNLITICKSEEFLKLNDSLCEQLMSEIFCKKRLI